MGGWTTGPNINTARQPRGCGTLSAALVAGNGTQVEKSDGTVWENAASLLVTRSIHACFGTQGAAVVCGGSSAETKYSSEKYDNTSWAAGPDMNTPRQLTAAIGTQTAGLVTGGYNDVAPANESSTEKFNGTSFINSTSMPVAKLYHAMAGIQTSALAFGGSANAGGTVVSTNYSWNDTTWSTGGALNTARCYLGGAGTSNASAISFGGSSSTITPTPIGTTETYNGTSWTAQTSLNTSRQGHAGLGAISTAYAVAGRDATANVATTEKYGNIMGAPTLALSLTGVTPTIKIRISVPELALTLTGVPPTPKTGKYIQVPTLELTLTGQVPFLKVPTVITVPTLALSHSTYAPSVIPALIFISTGFPCGKTASYKLVAANGTIIKDWTVADIEVVVDAVADKSVYGATTQFLGDAFQGWCFWKTNDNPPRVAWEAFNAYDTYIYGTRGDLSGVRYDMSQIVRPFVTKMHKMEIGRIKQVDNQDGTKTITYYEDDAELIKIIEFTVDATGKIRNVGV